MALLFVGDDQRCRFQHVINKAFAVQRDLPAPALGRVKRVHLDYKAERIHRQKDDPAILRGVGSGLRVCDQRGQSLRGLTHKNMRRDQRMRGNSIPEIYVAANHTATAAMSD